MIAPFWCSFSAMTLPSLSRSNSSAAFTTSYSNQSSRFSNTGADPCPVSFTKSVAFRISMPPGAVVIFQTHTPQGGPGDPLRLRVRFSWWAERSVPRLIAWYVVGNWVSQWWQDVAIWEKKVHLARPALSRLDGPVLELRRWFRQFLTDGEAGP